MEDTRLLALAQTYRELGAPQDQQMLIALMRQAQAEDDGILSGKTLSFFAAEFGVKESMLRALIRRVPDLRSEEAAHRLEICGTCRMGAPLRDLVERKYGVKGGGICQAAGFVYRVVPCMKNCKNGPSVRWDGQLYSAMNEKRLLALIEGGKNHAE